MRATLVETEQGMIVAWRDDVMAATNRKKRHPGQSEAEAADKGQRAAAANFAAIWQRERRAVIDHTKCRARAITLNRI